VRVIERLSIAPALQQRGPDLKLYVIFTDLPATNLALQAANQLAHDLDARVTLLVAQVVPYPLPRECPPVSIEFTEQVLSRLICGQGLETTVHVYLCRERNETIRQALDPDSIVVIGGGKRWWRNSERTLARLLRRDGHHVIVFDTNGFHPAEALFENVGSNR
jgi:hypothetical protein